MDGLISGHTKVFHTFNIVKKSYENMDSSINSSEDVFIWNLLI